MHYRSAIKGVPRQMHRVDTEYWTLVHRLMEAGWYRIGQDRDPSGKSWGFRNGHTRRCSPVPEAARSRRRARSSAGSLPKMS